MAELCFCNRPNIFPHHWAINSQARMNLAWSLISSSSEPRPRSKHECSCFTGTSCSMVTRTCFPLLSFSDQFRLSDQILKREYRFYDQTVWALLLKGWGGDIAGAMGQVSMGVGARGVGGLKAKSMLQVQWPYFHSQNVHNDVTWACGIERQDPLH